MLKVCRKPQNFFIVDELLLLIISVCQNFSPLCFSLFQASTAENDSRYIDGRVSEASVGKYQLAIEIPEMAFSHHPLYNRENVLAARLTELYDEYSLKMDKNLSEHYSDKV